MRTPNASCRITGLAEISGDYDVLFVDVWGVLHDGHSGYPGAAEALASARRHGTTVILITNSSSSVDAIIGKFDRIGISRDAWDAIMSSGELGLRHLTTTMAAAPVHVILEGAGPAWLGRLPNPVAPSVHDAAVLLVTGMPFHTETKARASGLIQTLSTARKLGLVLICTDPDEIYPENGQIRLGPGWLARLYREVGGEVLEFGKPHSPIYREALRLAGQPEPEKVLAIGDNIKTDILGAANHGFASLLVLEGGVHGDLSPDAPGVHFTQHGAMPDYIAPRLSW